MGIELIMGILLAVALGLIALQFWLGSPDNRSKRAFSTTPGRLLAGVHEGEVIKVLGRVAGVTEGLTAPLSRRPCACWEVLVEIAPKVEGATAFGNVTFANNKLRTAPGARVVVHDGQDFTIVDDSGDEARVRMEHVSLRIQYDREFKSSKEQHPTLAMREFLNNHVRIGGIGAQRDRRIRYREGIIEAGERVAIRGRVRFDVAPGAGGYRDIGRHISLTATEEEGELYVSDDPALI